MEGIQAAIAAGVDAIEFDIRVTKDKHVVLNHDTHMGRVSKRQHHIHEHSLKKLKTVPLHNGQRIATLQEAAEAAAGTPLVIEGKANDWARPLAGLVQKFPKAVHYSVISFNHQELHSFSLLVPSAKTYALENTKPLEVIRQARLRGFSGIDLNYWLLNPLTYALARYHSLDIIVYTVNSPLMARFLKLLYPRITITTDVPDQLQFLRLTHGRRRAK